MPSNVKFLGVGFSNLVNACRVTVILLSNSAAAKRLITASKDSGNLIDVTSGRKARSIIMLDDKTVVLSALNAQTLQSRVDAEDDVEE